MFSYLQRIFVQQGVVLTAVAEWKTKLLMHAWSSVPQTPGDQLIK